MEVKPGYKMTEVGVIPEDWRTALIEDIAVVGRGRVISHRDIAKANNPQYPIYSSQTSNDGVMGYIDTYDFEGDYVTWTTDGANAGTVFARKGRFNCTNVCGTIKVRVDNHTFVAHVLDRFAPRYVSRHLGNPKLMNDIMKRIRIPLPSRREEQDAIAAALSAVEALLEGLDRLIAKKRDLKQATMQQLLTGKTRLPGFSGEWEVKKLGEVGDIRSGGTPSTNQSHFWDGGVPWCTPTDITGLQGSKYLINTDRTISMAGLKSSSAEIIPPMSLIMTSRATIGECAINKIEMTSNQGFKNIVPFVGIDVEFLYYLMTTQKNNLVSLCGGSTFLEISKKQLFAFEILLPKDQGEQSAIAAILSDMDAELVALEARRNKTRDLKQAMMQELLTGRTRLVKPEVSHA